MRAGTISFRDWVGNNWADNIAKKGASRDVLDPRTVSNYFKELAVVVAWLRWCIWSTSAAVRTAAGLMTAMLRHLMCQGGLNCWSLPMILDL